jgi:hypothetical protein
LDTFELFVRTLNDLDSKTRSNDPYDILMIAGLVRKLLLDDYPLADQVNRKTKHKIRFEVGSEPAFVKMLSTATYIHGDAIDGKTAPGPTELLSKKEFLRFTIVISDGVRYSVKDVIKFAAHVSGAIHKTSPSTDAERSLQTIDSHFRFGRHSPSALQLRAIGRTVLNGLAPLRR